jgi:hypothetical protein
METCERVDRDASSLLTELEKINEDFEALKTLEADPTLYSSAERDELRALFGLHGLEDAVRLGRRKLERTYIGERQRVWKSTMEQAPAGSSGRQISERAYKQYGNILGRMVDRGNSPK